MCSDLQDFNRSRIIKNFTWGRDSKILKIKKDTRKGPYLFLGKSFVKNKKKEKDRAVNKVFIDLSIYHTFYIMWKEV